MPPMNTNGTDAGEGVPAGDEVYPLPVVAGQGVLDKPQWRSLAEKNGDPALALAAQDEFPPDAQKPLTAIDRRGFLQIVGGSLALAGASACWRPPEEQIYAYTKQPELTPGVSQHYATALTFGGYAQGVLVESYDARPTKIEGNPRHPNTQGASGRFEQANLLKLYDPNRAKGIYRRGVPQAYKTFLEDMLALATQAQKDGGAGLRFLVEPTSSPTLQGLRARVQQKFPNARFYGYATVGDENASAGAQAAFGQPTQARYDLTRARVIVSLDSDFLQWEPEHLRLTREFADKRVPEAGGMNRLYVAEATLTLTGAKADHRLRTRASEVLALARGLAAQLSAQDASLGQFGGATLTPVQQKWVSAVAKDLAQARGQSVILAGFRQPPAVHALAHALNAALGNVGQTVRYGAPLLSDPGAGLGSLRQLAQEMDAGKVQALLIDAYNPLYTAPGDLKLAQLFDRVPTRLYLRYYDDETAKKCNWLVPMAHELETWGDARSPDGTASIVQPLIAPLFDGITQAQLLAALLAEGDKSPYELVRAQWKIDGLDAENRWKTWLATGVVDEGAPPAPAAPALNAAGVSQTLQAPPVQTGPGQLELDIIPDYRALDGRFANNAWLQEMADPLTKVAWDNVAILGPKTAERLEVKEGDVLELSANGQTVKAPAFVLPGQTEDVVTVALGYGRAAEAEKISHQVGFDAYQLRSAQQPWFGPVQVKKTHERYDLASTQHRWSMEGVPGHKRVIAVSAKVSELAQVSKELESRREFIPTMQEPVDYSGVTKWGMGIDLSRCIGCNACMVACQAENNIPVVGKAQVAKSREMHWLAVDRYFVGEDTAQPEVVFQPRMCQHCETAPCEYVCPVNATVHSDEGLNEMVYNRCVGTRYCSNNCPYKVRRFNYLHWSAGKSNTEKMMMNPEVTVRARGVMEKCTFCVQRIERARITERVSGQPMLDKVQTACQQACPAHAITFGNLNDSKAEVSRWHGSERRYGLLQELGTRPRVGYLAQITNPNPELG